MVRGSLQTKDHPRIAHDAKLVFSFMKQRKCQDTRDLLSLLITLSAPLLISSIAQLALISKSYKLVKQEDDSLWTHLYLF